MDAYKNNQISVGKNFYFQERILSMKIGFLIPQVHWLEASKNAYQPKRVLVVIHIHLLVCIRLPRTNYAMNIQILLDKSCNEKQLKHQHKNTGKIFFKF